MAYTIIDRTLNGKRSSGNRAKFIKRVKKTVKGQMRKKVTDGNIDDLVSGKGKSVTVPKKDLAQPTFNHGEGGKREAVHPGNDRFTQGDRVDRPEKGGGGMGRGASKDGEGEDSFEFQLTFEEYLQMFFEDCELPDLKNTVIVKTDQFESKRAGFSTDGPSAQMNLEQTMRKSKGRRIGLKRKAKKERLVELEIREAELKIEIAELESYEDPKNDDKIAMMQRELINVLEEVMILRRKLRAVPFIDDTDLRYNRWERTPVPSSQAVMFCLMDVSGSMGEWEKEMAKRYFMLLYLFLTRNYKRVEVVWIRHHSVAKIVDEEEFFKSRETGGTVVSTAIELMQEKIKKDYSPSVWNIYGSQVSDGDNWGEDSHVVKDMLISDILPISQYYTYIEVNQRKSGTSDLWPIYESIASQYANFQMRKVSDASEIFPVFQQLFQKNRRVKKNAEKA